jgi:hypothetical protein
MIPELLKERTLDQNVIVPRDDQFFALPGMTEDWRREKH